MSVKSFMEKPSKVVLAVKLFYLVVGIGIIRATMTIIRHADVRSPYFLILTKFVIYTISLYLIYQIDKGKNWARFSMVIIFIIAIPLAILPTFASYSHNPVHTAFGYIQIALYIIGLASLFHGSSSKWFAQRKSLSIRN